MHSGTSVTFYSGHIGINFSLSNGFVMGSEAGSFLIEEAQVVAHEGHEPIWPSTLLDAYFWPAKTWLSMIL